MTETETELDSSSSWKYIAAAVAVIAAVFLIFLQFRGEETTAGDYNGFSFVNVDGFWQTQWQRDGQLYILDFRYHPKDVEAIPVSGKTDIRFQLEQVYITIDPDEEYSRNNAYVALAAIDIARKLTDPFERDVMAACTRNETAACADRPIVTCKNTNSTVIYLSPEGKPEIILDGNCATIKGTGEGISMAAHKAMFQWLGITG